jgi:hypothetical protein
MWRSVVDSFGSRQVQRSVVLVSTAINPDYRNGGHVVTAPVGKQREVQVSYVHFVV